MSSACGAPQAEPPSLLLQKVLSHLHQGAHLPPQPQSLTVLFVWVQDTVLAPAQWPGATTAKAAWETTPTCLPGASPARSSLPAGPRQALGRQISLETDLERPSSCRGVLQDLTLSAAAQRGGEARWPRCCPDPRGSVPKSLQQRGRGRSGPRSWSQP